MTFSIVARCEETGMFGSSVASSSPAVGARCSFARAGVGAVNTQNVTDPGLGPTLLDALESGFSPAAALARLETTTSNLEYRQLLVVDRNGASAVRTGKEALGVCGDALAEHVACGGNLLASCHIPEVMVEAFKNSDGHLADRLLTTMRAAIDAGGEEGPIHSSNLLVVSDVSWPIIDLRVDWSDDDPVQVLSRLWDIYRPQVDDYITRAFDPGASPSFGVPGDPGETVR
ncbi:MAG: DUF1028 domain-containing protein [Pseudomonadota bacterium]